MFDEHIVGTMKMLKEEVENNLSADYIEQSWNRDKELIRAVQTGNKELLKKIGGRFPEEEETQHYFANPLISTDLLRTRKNGMIIRNTTCRLAAGLAGVPSLYLHLISEKYGVLIEQATSIDYLLSDLSPEMFDDYCDLVANFSAAQYSEIIKDITLYISNHLQEQITVSKLSEIFHINTSHLARKFKKETGYTVSDYVNRQKINAAKLFFSMGYLSAMDVANLLGYNSYFYFSNTFKKIAGESPAQFMNRVQVEPYID